MHQPLVDTAPVLVIGATGRHAGTGTTVVDRVLAQGRPVRAMVRTDDARASELRRRGATTVVADLHDRASLVAAAAGVGAVYFTYPIAAGVIPAAANLASVLCDSGSTAHLVVMSMVVSSVDSPSRLGQAQAVAEQIFDWAGLNPTVLRFAGLFHENVLVLHESTIRQNGLIANSFGESPAPWISGSDAAEVAVAHLLAPRPASTQISYPPPAEIITHAELARIISAETGRLVQLRTHFRGQLAPGTGDLRRGQPRICGQHSYGTTYLDYRCRAVPTKRATRRARSAGAGRHAQPPADALHRLRPAEPASL